MREITITKNDSGQRIDRFLKKYLPKSPLSYIYKALRKDIKLNGKRVKEDYFLEEGDVLAIFLSDNEIDSMAEKKRRRTAKRQFTICYEDDNLIVVGKPFGLLVHGDSSEKKDTLANQVMDYLIESGAYNPRAERSFVPSPVHRLDRNTTGLVVFGKNAEALRALSEMFRKDGYVSKYYYTFVHGRFEEPVHLKNKLLKDEARNKGKVLPLTSPQGKYIETIARPVYAGPAFSLVEVELVTGRSHQIRAHMAYAGYPIAGDSKYGGRKLRNISTQLLHAAKLKFNDAPKELAYLKGLTIHAPLPDSWKDYEKDLLGKEINLD